MSTPNPQRLIAPHLRTLAEVVGANLDQELVDFVIIDLERDYRTGLYLTLGLAKRHPDKFVRRMYGECARFFRRVDALMSKGDSVSLRFARRMLKFPEPQEIRLGYAGVGSYGSGFGSGTLGDHVFNMLKARPVLRKAITIEPDAICFIPGIAMDRSSDIVATITKKHLIDFTNGQADYWGFKKRCLRRRSVRNCWDESRHKLIKITDRVPADDLDRTFLLVPKKICRSGPPMNTAQYFRELGGEDGTADDDTLKERLLEDAAKHPKRLTEFVKDRMKDPRRFKPRREFRTDDE